MAAFGTKQLIDYQDISGINYPGRLKINGIYGFDGDQVTGTMKTSFCPPPTTF